MQSTPAPRQFWKKAIPAALVAVVVIGGGYWGWKSYSGSSEGPRYRTAVIERGKLGSTVSASGQVTPVKQVTVGTQVSGQIQELFVDFNSQVKAGQLIAQIDPQSFEYQVRQAQADVDAAKSQVLVAKANAIASAAAVSRAKVDLTEAQRDLDRKADLVSKQFIAQSEGDRAKALVNTSNEMLNSVNAQLGVSEAQVKAAEAAVSQRLAVLAQAQINLSRTQIRSPVDGIIIKRAVERGQTVAASLQAPELFIIAQNLEDMRVEASIDEGDVGRIKSKQPATFTVDAFPGQTFSGTVDQVRKSATNVSNVVTYVAVVAFANKDNKLLPGMTANVRIVTDARENVLKVPNAALRVRMDADEVPVRKNNLTNGRIYLVSAGSSEDSKSKPELVNVKTGITDGTHTELVGAEDADIPLEGRRVVTGVAMPPTTSRGPRLPF